uniref:Uncharacterized protein n=1 Tax=Anguilla anguilla TaxID=7936 RepID=A0A0E9V5D1_ANGAN
MIASSYSLLICLKVINGAVLIYNLIHFCKKVVFCEPIVVSLKSIQSSAVF